MTARTEPLDLEATLEILDDIVYGDLFDCAVGLDEVVRFSRRAVGHHEATETLASPSIGRTIVRTDEYVTLAGREELVERRRKTRARALRLRRRAERMSLVLGMVPFVRGIILTGSVAAEAATVVDHRGAFTAGIRLSRARWLLASHATLLLLP